MKRWFQSFALAVITMFSMGLTCHAQQGPTQPTVVLAWTQSGTPGITKNCIYRGTVSGTYSLPGTCIPAGTTYTDTSPTPGTTYFYAVTAQVGTTESAYSTPVQAVVPANPSAPTGLTAPTVTGENKEPGDKPAEVVARVEWVKRPR